MATVAPLTEAQLRGFLSPANSNGPQSYLAAGKLIGRYARDEGGVTALWDWSPKAYTIAVAVEGNQLYSNCDCGRNAGPHPLRPCGHAAAGLGAPTRTFAEEWIWGRRPMTAGETWEAASRRATLERPPGPPPALAGLALPRSRGPKPCGWRRPTARRVSANCWPS